MAAEEKASKAEGLSEDAQGLSAASLWKGENDSDVEQMEAYDSNPLANSGAWTEDEAYTIYREKLVRLRTLYTGQLARLKHSLAERRREYLLEWMATGGDRADVRYPSHGGSPDDAAYRSYRRRSGEEAILQRKLKQRQIVASLEFFSRKEMRNSSRAHYHHLVRLQNKHGPPQHPPCSNLNCDNRCLPFATRCRRHICEDPKQLLYTSCCYAYPSGALCTSPVPVYLQPSLCGGHCDVAIVDQLARRMEVGQEECTERGEKERGEERAEEGEVSVKTQTLGGVGVSCVGVSISQAESEL